MVGGTIKNIFLKPHQISNKLFPVSICYIEATEKRSGQDNKYLIDPSEYNLLLIEGERNDYMIAKPFLK